MGKKYFAGFCNMNDKDLRANMFHHSCLVLFDADCDDSGEIIPPLRVIDSYGFYSHPIPEKKSIFDEPFTFLCQKVGINFRLRGSFGEWKQENIHDLTLGRGLTGRLFEKSAEQLFDLITKIHQAIAEQERFLSSAPSLLEQEKRYREEVKKINSDHPLQEFKFSVTGRGYVCRNAALNMIASTYDASQTKVLEYIDHLKGFSATNAIPRLTPGLDNIVIHAMTDKWEVRGNQSKYPFCEWSDAADNDKSSLIVVSAGGRYIDSEGNFQSLLPLKSGQLEIVDILKTLSRICELNLNDDDFKAWHKKICHYLFNIASCQNEHQQHIRIYYAEKYIATLMNDNTFLYKILYDVPQNLLERIQKLIPKYSLTIEDEKVRLC